MQTIKHSHIYVCRHCGWLFQYQEEHEGHELECEHENTTQEEG